jgi:3-oxoadipyl-CoA thiolase
LFMPRPEAVIVDAVRTPIGRYGGVFRDVRPDDLSALVIRGLLGRTGLDPSLLDDVIWGCANQAGEDNRNIGRMASLLAGIPASVPATTVNRLCGSSMDALHHAARAIWSGDMRVVLTGGVESMSRAPYSVPKNQTGSFGNLTAYDTALGWRYPNPGLKELFPLESMGETAENVAERYQISRADQDAFACESHLKAFRAHEAGRFAAEIVPISVPQKKGAARVIDRDEGPRAGCSIEQLSALSPAFRSGGTVTAGNSSSLNDGASALLVMSDRRASELGLKPLARIVATGVAGVDPRYMGMGPVPATQMAMKKSEMALSDIRVVELNEAFASQSLAVIRELGLDPSIVNPNGGAIAIGHPLGCSGARILTTLLHELQRRQQRFGLATMCIGVGQGIATIIEAATA